MWIFTVAPEWAIHLIFGLGVAGVIAGFVLGMIPLIKKYSLPIKIISLLVLALGVYLQGGLADYKEWQLKVSEMETKVKEAESKSNQVNTEIVEKVVTETKVIREKGDTIVKYIDREVVKTEEVVKFIENCPIPQIIIETHNMAATNTLKLSRELNGAPK
jgi:hypothetical protein